MGILRAKNENMDFNSHFLDNFSVIGIQEEDNERSIGRTVL